VINSTLFVLLTVTNIVALFVYAVMESFGYVLDLCTHECIRARHPVNCQTDGEYFPTRKCNRVRIVEMNGNIC